MISQSSIEEVKEEANLVELVSEITAVKRQGSSYSALCPFHQEKSPSFHIRDSGRFYHCFGCGASGNSISFYMQTKGLSFPQAVEELAQRFNVTLEKIGRKDDPKKEQSKLQYYKANKIAAQFFEEGLRRAPKEVKEYVKKRGLTEETISAYAIGFAPLHWSALCDFLRKNGVRDETIFAVGLARRNPKGELYDAFRGRLMFPIWSDTRKISGFGGRMINALLTEEQIENSPKYLNSPESPIYQKNKTLFGLPQALPSIRQLGYAYLVEGYMDVIGLWQVGVRNSLATCGTALTENHVRRLSYLCKRAFIHFDGDSAGRNAASKSFLTFLNSGIDAKILFLPSSEDPDSLAVRLGNQTDKFLQELPKHPLIDCYIDALVARYSAGSVRDLGAALKGQVCEEVAQILKRVKNPVERNELTKQASFRLMTEESLLSDLASGKKNISAPAAQVAVPADSEQIPDRPKIIRRVSELPRLDRDLLLCVIARKEKLASEVLRQPDLCLQIDASTLMFLEGLDGLISAASLDAEQKKDSIKGLLKQFGDSWIQHWKLAFEMDKDSRVDLEKTYRECCLQVRKNKLNQALNQLEVLISQSSEDSSKLELAQKRVSLQKQLNML